MGTRIVALANQKGGVGKTTTAVNLGAALAREGERVLLVGADPQGDLAKSLGIREPNGLEITLANHLNSAMNDTAFPPCEGIVRYGENLDLMPGNIQLASIDIALAGAKHRERMMGRWADQLRGSYDRILIDCPPSLGMLTLNALAAADSVLIPVAAEYLPSVAMTDLLATIQKVRRSIKPELSIEGAVITMSDRRTNLANEVEETIREGYGAHMRVFDAVIPRGVKASEATALGCSIFEHSPRCKAAIAYASLCKEVMGRG